ncbi:MAG: alanine racemase [Acidobacteriaceae bacterium]
MIETQRPTWAEIALSKLKRNFLNIQARVGEQVEVCAVVKCGAYGHGAVDCARALLAAGARWFAVSSPEEGIALRAAGVVQPILLLGGFYREQAKAVVEHELTPSIWEEEQIGYLSRATPKAREYPVHVEIDTGMSRQGVPAAHAVEFLNRVRTAGNLALEGLSQHYAAGERMGEGAASRQEERFASVIQKLRESGVALKYVHMANSSAAIARAHILGDARFAMPGAREMVRCGIALYGYCLPLENKAQGIAPWENAPVLAWKTRVISQREAPPSVGIGYSGAYTTTRTTRIASLPVGYGDGLNRLLSSRGRVIVRGQFAPIIGNISMDMTLIDVTDVAGAEIGDEVVIIGEQGGRTIDAWEHAELCRTIPYEILCNIGIRVPRVYP